MTLKELADTTGNISLQCFNMEGKFLGIFQGAQIKPKLLARIVKNIEINPFLQNTLSVFVEN